jgi:transmembrane sensor
MEKLIQKFLDNRCTPEEADKVLGWLQTEEGEAFLTKKLSEEQKHYFGLSQSDLYPELDSGSLLREIQEKRMSAGKPVLQDKRLPRNRYHRSQSPSGRNRRYLPLAIAAVLTIIAVLIFNPMADVASLQEEIVSYQLYETDRAERKSIQLSDGSKVILNHESSLRVPDDFSKTNRRLSIQGEVWFEVVSDDNHLFLVETSNSQLQVLGTSFMMKSHPGEETTRVVVADGKVSLGAKEADSVQEKIIEKNQGGLLVTGHEIELEEIPDPERFFGWKDGKLIFYNTSFEEVAKRLERWYDVECIITDPAIKRERFTSVFEDEPLVQVLDVIALSMNVQYEIDNRTITFKTNNL